MSKIFEALQKSQSQGDRTTAIPEMAAEAVSPLAAPAADLSALDQCAILSVIDTPKSRLVSLSDERSLGAEKMRVLSTRLRHLRHPRRFTKLLISSCMKGEGKSVVSANLAITLAKNASQRTLLVDGDLRQPGLSRMFGSEKLPGIADWYRDQVPIHQFLRRSQDFPLWFLPAGKVPGQPLEVLQSDRLAQLMTELGEVFEWVIVDSPPLSPLADSTIWAALTEATVLVVREGQTPTKLLRNVLDSFQKDRLVGVVVNESKSAERKYYDLYYRKSRNGDHP
ncbi:MAG TPA: CpsD/CapB family tyrosine-protein kinase [Terriglobales bacterium]|nr:CpsD/CapB family tyrosine-protein kinase [Terriglobales bacterium]